MLLTYQNAAQQPPQLQEEERRLHFYEKGDEIPLVSQGLWQVSKGVIQLGNFNANGEEVVLGWAQSFNFFGLWLTNIDTYQAKALSDVYLQWYSLKEIQSSVSLSNLIVHQFVIRIRQSESLLAIAGIKRVEDRLTALLKLLKKDLGEVVNNGTRISVRFTHQNLASIINTTRVTVTRILGDFQRENLITFDSERHIIIH